MKFIKYIKISKYVKIYPLRSQYHVPRSGLRTLFHIEGAQIFQRGELQNRLTQLSLEQDPSHNTRSQDSILQNRRPFLP